MAKRIYLHPNTEDTAKLEEMAGVPAGTQGTFQIIEEYCDAGGLLMSDVLHGDHVVKSSGSTRKLAPRVFGVLLRSRSEIAKYHFFLNTGFGEFIHPEGECEIGDSGIESGDAAQEILDLNEVCFDADFTEGVQWR